MNAFGEALEWIIVRLAAGAVVTWIPMLFDVPFARLAFLAFAGAIVALVLLAFVVAAIAGLVEALR